MIKSDPVCATLPQNVCFENKAQVLVVWYCSPMISALLIGGRYFKSSCDICLHLTFVMFVDDSQFV